MPAGCGNADRSEGARRDATTPRRNLATVPSQGDNVIRLDDGEKGLSDRTIARRLATLSGLYGYLSACNLIGANPVPTGSSISARTNRPRARTAPLIRKSRTLPHRR